MNFAIRLLRQMSMGLPLVLSAEVFALEGGNSVYPHGNENFLMGAVPPKGLYGLTYASYYRADHVNDNNGDDMNIPGFDLNVTSLTLRPAWVPGVKFLGGDVLVHGIFPLLNVDLSAAGHSDSESGMADITTGVGVGFHHSKSFHTLAAVNVTLPTGKYDKNAMINLGRNYLAYELVYVLTYVQPKGINADARVGYILNQENDDTNYTSGDEFHVDYALGWGFGNGWTAGVSGYFLNQVNDDEMSGMTLEGHRAKGFSIGPSVKYMSDHHWFLTAKWEKEFNVKNRPEGDQLWLKAVFPL